MKLLTKAIEKKLGKIGEHSERSSKDITVPWKLFDCMGAGTWYLYEYDPETGEAFGFVTLGDPQNAELGYVDLNHLKKVLGWRLERDRGFSPMNLQELIDTVKSGGHV